MLQIYTGNGKGKTTAAFGLAMRAFGRNKKVGIVQFAKPEESGEYITAKKLGIEIYHYGFPGFIIKKPREGDYEQAKLAWEKARYMISNNYDLVILDELNIALFYNLLNVVEIVEFIKNFKDKKEIVITGRYAKNELIEISDLITEMTEVRHYYEKGISAREGIEF